MSDEEKQLLLQENFEALLIDLVVKLGDEIVVVIFDHFPTVYKTLGADLSKRQRAKKLVQYALKQGQLELLLQAVKQINGSLIGSLI